MKIREHRGLYVDSMATVEEIPASIHSIFGWAQGKFEFLGEIEANDIEIKPYGGMDERNGWDTHMVKAKGNPLGWIDQNIENTI